MTTQFGRKVSLVLVDGEKGLDLSTFHFTFQVRQNDLESPANCSIRVYNLSATTAKKIKGQFSRIVLSAGYDGGVGVIFDGTIKQFREGRERATDTYLDILAADGDKAYNFSVVNKTLSRDNSRPKDVADAALGAMAKNGVTPGYQMAFTGGILPRGKVLFGMARSTLRQLAQSQGATWTINNGKVDITPLDGYKPGEAVVINSNTGMVGFPEQTEEGVKVKVLLNPRIQIGSLMQIDNQSINQTTQQNPNSAPVPFNKYVGLQLLASIAADGFYRVYVAEHTGDTKGNEFYTHIIGLALNPDTKKVSSL